MKKLFLFFFFLIFAYASASSQILKRSPDTRPQNGGETTNNVDETVDIDSLRSLIESKSDSIVYTAKFIKFTREEFLRDSTRLFPIDTTTKDFHRYRVIDKPENPTMNLGLNGLSYRDMLFDPAKTIGFDVGYHYYDRYLINSDSLPYFQARAPYSELYYETPAFGRLAEQSYHVLHSQNVKPNWNVGGRIGKIGSRAYYGAPSRLADRLMVDHLNGAIWNWYESPNKRYTLLANGTFNNLKGYENGSILNEDIFTTTTKVDPEYEEARLNTAKHNWRKNTLYLKQFYNIGNQKVIDSNAVVLPTQRVSYKLQYQTDKYFFSNDSYDATGLLKNYYIYTDSSKTSDSTIVQHLQNEFNYSFYLRGKKLSFLRNELKINAGIQHDFYKYQQYTFETNYQNITLKGDADYSFNDRATLNFKLQQIIQGTSFGDFLYEATSEIKLGNKVGSVILEAYSQNQSPARIFERQLTNHYQWNLNFQKTNTQHLGFSYVIPKYYFKAKAEYFLVSNHLYFTEGVDGDAYPAQLGSNLNLLKLSLKKDFRFGKFTSENYVVYQKTDFQTILRTPEIYTFNSIFMHQDFFKVLKTEFGFDLRYYSKYTAPSYAPAIGVFYNSGNLEINNYPVVDAWIRTNWKRASLFLRYDYINKGLYNNGYYTVNRYPMPYSLGKFGVVWRFYD